MKINRFLLGGSAALLVLLSGCGTTSDYVDATDTQAAVKNKDRMSSSDWIVITKEAGNQLLASQPFVEYLQAYAIDAENELKKAEASGQKVSTREKLNIRKPLLMLSVIENKTDEHIETQLLTERLRELLFNSGKVRFTTYAAGKGFQFQCVGNEKYISYTMSNSSSADKYYWNCFAEGSLYDPLTALKVSGPYLAYQDMQKML
ncbi:MAG: hypothetical protein J5858_11105, partial [Lentisphaeria bacterium]|nr:hypothetical protein [Lentisphaeria bacterium]